MFDEVDTVVVDERVDDVVDRGPYDCRLPPLEHLGPECGSDERSIEPVLRFVHRDNRAREQRAHRLTEPPRRVRLVIPQNLHALVVGEHRIDRSQLGRAGRDRQRPCSRNRAASARRSQMRVGVLEFI